MPKGVLYAPKNRLKNRSVKSIINYEEVVKAQHQGKGKKEGKRSLGSEFRST